MKTDETKGEYEVEDNTENAMAMIGTGYDLPTVVIEPPRTITARHKGRMVDIEEPAWVKFSTDFKKELKTLDEYSLKVFLYIGLSVNWQTGTAYPGVRKIAVDTGMDKDTVVKAVNNLEQLGFLTVQRKNGESNIYEPVRYISIGTVPSKGTPTDELSPENTLTVPPNSTTVPRSRRDSAQLEELEELDSETLKKQAFHARQEELKDHLAENSIEAAIILGKPLAKSAQKVRDSVEFHGMICAQLARLPFNFEGDKEVEQESFRKFLKAKRREGQELETWVNWWMSDEWRVANPPWKLTTIKVKWLEAFPPEPKSRTESSGHYA